MTLALTTGFQAAVSSAEAEIRFFVQLSVGLASAPVHFYAVSGTVANSATDRYPEAIRSVSQISAVVDPFTHELDYDEVFIDVDAEWLRPIVVAYRLRGIARLTCKIGAATQDTDDFMPYFAGRIKEITPIDGTYHITCLSQVERLKETTVNGAWFLTHPLEVIYTDTPQFGYSVLEDAGFYTTEIDTDAFDPEHANYADIGHLIVGRCGGPNDAAGRPTPVRNANAFDIIQEICTLLNGHFFADENGKFTFRKFDASAAAVFNWTGDHILENSFKQIITDENICNHINVRYGRQANGEYGREYGAQDVTSQQAFCDKSDEGKYKSFFKTIETDWVNGVLIPWRASFAAGDASIDGAYGDTHMLCGNYNDRTAGISSGGATRRVSADRPLYLRIDTGSSVEYAKCESLDRKTAHRHTVRVSAYNGAALFYLGPYCGEVDFDSLTRGIRGYAAVAGDSTTEIRDITCLVLLCDELLGRFAYGCPVIEVSTLLSEYAYQIGDVGTVTIPEFCSYGNNGITSSTTWEIIGKEVNVYGDPPSIKWTLAVNGTASVSPTISPDAIRIPVDREWALYNGQEVLTQPHIASGLTMAVPDPKSLTGTLIAGSGWVGGRYITVPNNVEYTFTASKDSYVYWMHPTGLHVVEETLGAAAPPAAPLMLFIAKVVTDGTGITSITTTGQETTPLDGDKIKAGTIAETQLGVGSVTNLKLGDGAVTNTKFSAEAGDRLVGSKLLEGTGPLTKLSSAGLLDNITSVTARSLDNITDGATYGRVKIAGLTAGVVNTDGIVATAVTAAKIADSAIASTHVIEGDSRFALNLNPYFVQLTRG